MKQKEKEPNNECYVCKKRLSGKESDKCWIFLCDYNIWFCKKHYKEVLLVLRKLKKDYPQIKEFDNSKSKYWHLFCKIQEWVVLEYLLNKKDGSD